MTQEITAFSLDEARRLVAQWRARADQCKQAADTMSPLAGIGLKIQETELRHSAAELEAILPATPCPHCSGIGEHALDGRCPHCEGTGQRVGENNGTDIWVEPCTQCEGKGKTK